MRKMADSGRKRCSVSLSARAEARSLPKGFSTTTRASLKHWERASPSTTVPKKLGGMAR